MDLQVDPLPVVHPSTEVCNRCTVRITDLEAAVDEHLQWYRENVLRKVEDFMAGWDRQKLVELDANQPQEELYKASIAISVYLSVCLNIAESRNYWRHCFR